MRKQRVLALVPKGGAPPDSLDGFSPDEIQKWRMEFDVVTALRAVGHEVRVLDVELDLGKIRTAIDDFQPQLAFMMLEGFHGVPVYDQHVVAYLELMRVPYSGCNPRGLMLAHDKALAKKILSWHRIPTPGWRVFPWGRVVKPPKSLRYPQLVKSTTDESSAGISQASVVHNDEELIKRVLFVQENWNADALVEDYIDGREIYVGVMGNLRLQTFPPWELLLENLRSDAPMIATEKVKFDLTYQKKVGVVTKRAEGLGAAGEKQLQSLAKRVYRRLGLSGYARMDFRLDAEGRPYLLEANPNPDLSSAEDFAASASAAGLEYEQLIDRIVGLGLQYRAKWKAQTA
jgi:D-alanine-D-alanine ligase